MSLRLLFAKAKLHACRISMDGCQAAGNMHGLREESAKEARLLAEIRPLGTNPEPRDDDDEDGHDDDLKVAPC